MWQSASLGLTTTASTFDLTTASSALGKSKAVPLTTTAEHPQPHHGDHADGLHLPRLQFDVAQPHVLCLGARTSGVATNPVNAATLAGSFDLVTNSSVLLRSRPLDSVASSADLTTAPAVPRRDRSLKSTASTADLTSSSAIPRRGRSLVTLPSSFDLTTSSLTVTKSHLVPVTSVAATFDLTSGTVIVLRGRSPPTLASAASLTSSAPCFSEAAAQRPPPHRSTSRVPLPCSGAVVRSSPRRVAPASHLPLPSWGARAAPSPSPLRLRSPHRHPSFSGRAASSRPQGPFDLTTSPAHPLQEGAIQIVTTASSASLTTEVVPLRFAYQVYSASSFSLTTAPSEATVTAKPATELTTLAGSFDLATSSAVLTKSGMVVLTTLASSADLTTSPSTVTVMQAGLTYLTTLASSARGNADVVPVRFDFRIFSSISGSLTTIPALLRTTGASVIYTYAPAIRGDIVSAPSELDFSTTRLLLTPIVSTLTATTAIRPYGLDRTDFVYAPAIVPDLVTAPSPVLVIAGKLLHPLLSSITLTASASPLLRTNSGTPTTKYLTTLASSASLTCSDARLQPIKLDTDESEVELIAGSAAVTVTHAATPQTIYLSTFASQGTLTTDPATLFYSQHMLLTLASSASLTTSAVLSRGRLLTTTAASAELISDRARLIGWCPLTTLASAIELTTDPGLPEEKEQRQAQARRASPHRRSE